MLLKTTKTDKADALMIRFYAETEYFVLWHPPVQYLIEAMELHGLIDVLIKQGTALKNKLHGIKSKGISASLVNKVLKKQVRKLNREIERMGLAQYYS